MTVKCILFLADEDDNGADVVVRGFEDRYAAMIELLLYLRGFFREHGQDVELFPLDDGAPS